MAGPVDLPLLGSVGAIAADLVARIAADPAPILYIAASERSAAALNRVLQAMLGPEGSAHFPAWDVPPLESDAPSRAVAGRRMSVLRWLTNRDKRPAILVTAPAAALRRVPPRAVFADAHVELKRRAPFDPQAFATSLERLGYSFDGRVDEAGEIARSARIFDVFPAAASHPCRIEHAEGQVISIASYDPATQRSLTQTDHLIVDAASETIGEEGDAPRETLFDYLPDARLVLEEGAQARAEIVRDIIRESREAIELRRGHCPADPRRLFLDPEEWQAATRAPALRITGPDDDEAASRRVPRFSLDPRPARALADFVGENPALRVVLSAPSEALAQELRRRAARRLDGPVRSVPSWAEALDGEPGTLPVLVLPLAHGFVSPELKLAVVTAGDVLGWRAESGGETVSADPFGNDRLRIGDLVVHFDHGVGALEAIETLEIADGTRTDVLRLGYKDGATLMVPVAEIDALSRYGGDAASMPLDKLNGKRWTARRNAMVQEVKTLAEGMLELAKARAKGSAETVVPPAEPFQRFCDAFPFELTPDQGAIVETILTDLGSGRPMDRLVCGDVGFGKTEVALRAIAAVVLSGGQVALAAPTTVLVKQHLRNLRRRLAPFGIEVGELSRMASAREMKATRAGLADGSLKVVVGTSAIATKATRFKDLRLVVLDEEQRFGTRDKESLRARARHCHRLALTATPIPRTLEAGFVGLCDLSILATPPSNRQPVYTEVRALDEDLVRDVLTREKRRAGQSFVVVPRVSDIEPTRALLQRLVPDLSLRVAHGRLPAEEIDAVMLGFGEGEGDVLLATNLIESGIDVPRANTMIVLSPELFGLSQLHQLRGRVGRSARRGYAYLLTEEVLEKDSTAARRLRCLAELSGLGSGFLISARDLDMRGAGDLLGETQAGHMKLFGIDLYRQMLERALAEAEGRVVEERRPEISLGTEGFIPPDYVGDPETRIDLYFRLARLTDAADLSAFEEELADRFGTMPAPVRRLVGVTRLRIAASAAGLGRIEAGPGGIALAFAGGAIPDCARALEGGEEKKGRLVFKRALEDVGARIAAVEDLVADLDDSCAAA
ncbi:hypothetical protein ASG48_01870 [Aurantimonas sp. Leaf443]|nr:hypothetical protein ASG48_01870 [Aurantimonas sp. Leaf443]